MGEENLALNKFQIDLLQAVDQGEILEPKGVSDTRDWRTLLKLGYVTMENIPFMHKPLVCPDGRLLRGLQASHLSGKPERCQSKEHLNANT